MDINTVVISGRATKAPEVKDTHGVTIVRCSIASNHSKKVNGEWQSVPGFFEVVAFGKLGEYLARTVEKGTRLMVSGELRWSSWQDAQGQKRSKIEILCKSCDVQKNSTARAEEKVLPDDLF